MRGAAHGGGDHGRTAEGGAGKTTLAANLAVALAPGKRVALLDADPQKSLARWQSIRAERNKAGAALTFIEVAGWRIGIELDRIARSHDLVVIDSPPQIDTDARQAVRAADLVLVPLQPSRPTSGRPRERSGSRRASAAPPALC